MALPTTFVFIFFFYVRKLIYSGFGAFLYTIIQCNKDKMLAMADEVTNKMNN